MGNSPGVWEAAPTACAVVICFASCIGSINRLECEHRRKDCSVSGDVMLSRTGDATSICAIPVPTFRLQDSLSECYITGRCLPAMTPRVLVMGDEVRTEENFFRRTVTINSFTGRR